MAAIHGLSHEVVSALTCRSEFEVATPVPMSPAMAFKARPAPGMAHWCTLVKIIMRGDLRLRCF